MEFAGPGRLLGPAFDANVPADERASLMELLKTVFEDHTFSLCCLRTIELLPQRLQPALARQEIPLHRAALPPDAERHADGRTHNSPSRRQAIEPLGERGESPSCTVVIANRSNWSIRSLTNYAGSPHANSVAATDPVRAGRRKYLAIAAV